MKKALPMPVIAATAAVAVLLMAVIFFKFTADPAPTVTNVPDYAKMSPEEVNNAKANSKSAEAAALANRPGP